MLRRLAPADYATLVGLTLGWAAASLFLLDRPDAATLLLLVAFLFDKADGSLARRGYGSSLGHQLDALSDVVVYLVPTAIIVFDLFVGAAVSGSLSGAIVIGFGVLRLARHSADDGLSRDEPSYYRGITAFHMAAWALAVRLGVSLTTTPAVIGAVAITIVAPLMIASFRIYITKKQLVGAVLVGAAIAAGTLV